MKYHKSVILFMVLMFALALAACGGGGDDNDNASDNSQNTQQPSNASNSSDDANTSSGSGGEISMEDELGGTITVTLPDGWFGDTAGGIVASNSEASLGTSDPSALQSGQVVVLIDYIPSGSSAAEALGVGNTSLPKAVIDATVDMLNDNEDGEVYEVASQPRMTVNRGHQIGTSYGTLTIGDALYAVAISVKKVPNVGFARMISTAPEGEIEGYTGTLNDIAGSITYTAAESE